MKVCTAPPASVTVSVMTDPAGRSVVPVIVGVVSLPSSGASTVRAGGVRSSTPLSLALPLLPAASVPTATTL